MRRPGRRNRPGLEDLDRSVLLSRGPFQGRALHHGSRCRRAHAQRAVRLDVRLFIRGPGKRAFQGRAIRRWAIGEWAVCLDLVLWAMLVRHLVLLLGRALDARFLTH